MKYIIAIIRIPIKLIKWVWLAISLITAAVAIIWNLPTLILGTIVYSVDRVIQWIDEKVGLLGRKKFKVEDDEPISEDDAENASQEVRDTTT